MKTERRHELKENDLTHALETGRAYVQGHGKRIGLTAVLVITAVVLTSMALRSRQATAEDHWRQKNRLDFATPEAAKTSLDSLMVMVQESDNDRFILSALIEQGSSALGSANSEEAVPDQQLNDLAREAFELLLKRFPDNPLAFGAAHMGLATVEENAFVLDGDSQRKEAARLHLDAITGNPDLHTMPLYQAAQERREALDDTFSTVAFAPPLPKAEAQAAPSGPLAPTPAPQIIQLDGSGNIQLNPTSAIQIRPSTSAPTEQPAGEAGTPAAIPIKIVPVDAPSGDTGAASQPGTSSKNPDVTDEPAPATDGGE